MHTYTLSLSLSHTHIHINTLTSRILMQINLSKYISQFGGCAPHPFTPRTACAILVPSHIFFIPVRMKKSKKKTKSGDKKKMERKTKNLYRYFKYFLNFISVILQIIHSSTPSLYRFVFFFAFFLSFTLRIQFSVQLFCVHLSCISFFFLSLALSLSLIFSFSLSSLFALNDFIVDMHENMVLHSFQSYTYSRCVKVCLHVSPSRMD